MLVMTSRGPRSKFRIRSLRVEMISLSEQQNMRDFCQAGKSSDFLLQRGIDRIHSFSLAEKTQSIAMQQDGLMQDTSAPNLTRVLDFPSSPMVSHDRRSSPRPLTN